MPDEPRGREREFEMEDVRGEKTPPHVRKKRVERIKWATAAGCNKKKKRAALL